VAESLDDKVYSKTLYELQTVISKIQASVIKDGLRVVIVVEGRDAAGKGSAIKRLVERVSPRIFEVVALPVPTDREKSQLYMQRYVKHLPAAGEVVVFDRSWYNRAGVEKVMGFCTHRQYQEFLHNCPLLEDAIVRDGIILLKYFFDVSPEEQRRRFEKRRSDPTKYWKLSSLDIEAIHRWDEYTHAYNRMFETTDTTFAPWYVIPADDKRRARLNFLAHVAANIPYEDHDFQAPELPPLNTDGSDLVYTRRVPELY
jgi:polyphosphate kinase 2